MFYTYIEQIKLSTGQWKTAVYFALAVVKPWHMNLYIREYGSTVRVQMC